MLSQKMCLEILSFNICIKGYGIKLATMVGMPENQAKSKQITVKERVWTEHSTCWITWGSVKWNSES